MLYTFAFYFANKVHRVKIDRCCADVCAFLSMLMRVKQSVQPKIVQEDQIPPLTIGWLAGPMGGQLREIYCVFCSCIQSETSQFSHGRYRVSVCS